MLYTAWEIDKYNDYQRVRKDIATAKVVMPTVLHDIAWRAMQVHGALGTTNEMPFFGMIHGAGVMGIADGPTEVHKVTVARQVLRDYKAERRHVADRVDPEEDRRGQGQVRGVPRAGGGKPVSDHRGADADHRRRRQAGRLAGRPGPRGRGAARARLHLGRQPERDLRAAPRRPALRHADPPADAPAELATTASCGSGGSSRRSNGTDVPHTEAIAVCTDPSVLGRTFYLMGFVDGWSPMQTRRQWPAPFDTDLEARRGLAFQLVEGIALLSKVDWRAKGLSDLGRPDGFHERQVDRWTAFLERIKGRELPGFDEAAAWLRAHRPIDYIPGLMHGDYQFANVMFRHGAPARLAAIVDWEMGTVGDPKLDLAWVVHTLARGHERRRRRRRRVRRHVRHALALRGARALLRRCRAARSTTSTTTSCSPSGSWPSSSSRATSAPATTTSCRHSGRSCSTSCGAADLAESTDYSVLVHVGPGLNGSMAPASPEVRAALCRTYGEPEVVESTEVPAPAAGSQDRSASGARRRRSTFPTSWSWPTATRCRCRHPSSRAASSPGRSSRWATASTDSAVGERVFGSTMVGAFAEEIVVPATRSRDPDRRDDRQVAAAFGVAYRTAYHVLRSVAALQPGEELVVLGAGGGVGTAAVQLGASLGATVTAIASTPEKLEAAASCGAHRLIQHRRRRPRQALREALPRRRRRRRPGRGDWPSRPSARCAGEAVS